MPHFSDSVFIGVFRHDSMKLDELSLAIQKPLDGKLSRGFWLS